MAVSKVIINGVTKIDLTQDTVTPSTLQIGKSAHNCAGEAITGESYGSSATDGIEKALNFRDYDGTIVYSYNVAEALSLEALPENPTHGNQTSTLGPLVSQGWNWTLAEIQSYLVQHPDGVVDVGQLYATDSGNTRIYCYFNNETPNIYLGLGVLGTVDVDWGDGSTHSTIIGSSISTTTFTYHAYSKSGGYIITISPSTDSTYYAFSGDRTTGSYILRNTNSTNETANLIYANLSSVEKIELGNRVTLRSGAFNYCRNLETITIANDTSFSESSYSRFGNCNNLKAIVIPPSQDTIYYEEYLYCYNLKNVMLPPTISAIYSYAFYYCYSLSSITLSENFVSAGTEAFANCQSLESIVLPSSLEQVGQYMFSGCANLKKVRISNGPTIIGERAFANCGTLRFINIPPSITTISAYAFSYCTSLASIELPNTLTSIYGYAFYNCSNFEYVCLPGSLETFGSSIFSLAYSLKEVGFEPGITSVANYMFDSCYSLQSITLPQTIEEIYPYAFTKCTGLKEIHLLGANPPTLPDTAFYNGSSGFRIYVPYTNDHSVLNAYKAASGWSTYATYIFEEPEGWRRVVGISVNGGLVAIGTEFSVSKRKYGDVDFIVRARNDDKVTGDETAPTVTIQQKYIIPYLGDLTLAGGYSIDAREAFHEPLTTIIPAGTVCQFTTNTPSSVPAVGYSAGTYHFKATTTIPIGAVLGIRDSIYDLEEQGIESPTITDTAVVVFLNQKAETPIAEFPIESGSVSGALDLGTWGTTCNHTDRVAYGSNNIAESNLNVYLNTCTWDYDVKDIWEPATKYDMLEESCGDLPGYLTGFPAAFRAALRTCDIHVITSKFESQDSQYTANSEYTYSCKVFMPSRKELFGGAYYTYETSEKQYDAFIGTNNAAKALTTKEGSEYMPYFVRTPYPYTAHYAVIVYDDEGAYTMPAVMRMGLCPAMVLG